jgi:hypothetical protein
LDCFATLFRGHVNIHCYGDEVKDDEGVKKRIYVGYVGEEIKPIRLKMKDVRKAMTDAKKNLQTKLSHRELGDMEQTNSKKYEELKLEALDAESKILKKIPDDTTRTNKSKVFKNKVFYYHHFKYFNKGLLPGLNIIRAWVENAVFKILNGGNSFWVTCNYDYKQKMIKYETLKKCPFGSAEDKLMVSYINPSFDPAKPVGKDNEMVLKDSLYSILVNHRINHFHNDVDVVPFLKNEEAKNVNQNLFNMFPGLKFKYEKREYKVDNEGIPIPPDSIKHWIDHYKYIAPANIKKTFLQWWGFNIQKCKDKAFNMLIYGKKGTGKSIIYEAYKRMIGTYFCMQITKLEQVTGRFNKRLEGKLLCNVNEATNFPTIREWNVFKALTTELELDIEPKGKECYNVSFSGKFLTTTNCRYSARVTAGDRTADDRRNCCIEIGDEHRNDDAWFAPLVKDLESTDDTPFRELFLYFANFPLDGFKPQRPPMTKYKMDLIGDQAPDIVTFMREVCENMTNIEYKRTEDDHFISAPQFYREYDDWCGRCRCTPKRKMELYALMNDVFKMDNKGRPYKPDGTRHTGYQINRAELLTLFKEHYANDEFDFNIAE